VRASHCRCAPTLCRCRQPLVAWRDGIVQQLRAAVTISAECVCAHRRRTLRVAATLRPCLRALNCAAAATAGVVAATAASARSREAREQILEKTGRLPDYVIACVGGGSNAIGMFHPFVKVRGLPLTAMLRVRTRPSTARAHDTLTRAHESAICA
jgi:hypothetical protein